MKPVNRVLTSTLALTATIVATFFVTTRMNGRSEARFRNSDSMRIERGRYIVHQSGLCIDCHSPRDEKGAYIPSKHLTGSPLPFVPTIPMPWVSAAPPIAGLPAGFTEDDTIRFLMTGERPNGRPPPLPPMPEFRFDRDDATAVAAYLRSLRTNIQ